MTVFARLRPLATRCRGELAYWFATAALAALLGCGSLVWALSTPAFHGPDETVHVNSVSRVVDGGGWPAPYEARVMGSTWQAVEESGLPIRVGVPAGHDSTQPPSNQRSALTGTTDLPDGGRDQMVQHPPGYYVVAAGVVAAAGGGDLHWDTAVMIMRFTSVLLTAGAVPLVVGIGRRVSGSKRAGLVGGATLLGIPFFVTLGGYVTNDSMLLLTVSATLYAGVRAVDAARPRRWLAATGLFLGLALLTKGLALLVIPVVGVLTVMSLWHRPRRWTRRLGLLALPQVIALAVGGWWWLRNLIVLGSIQPSQCGQAGSCPSNAPANPPPRDFVVFSEKFVDRFAQLFWGRGGLEEIAYPRGAVQVASAVLLVVLVSALLGGRRRGLQVVLLAVPVLIAATIFTNAYDVYLDIGSPSRGVQGRYVFCGAAAISASVAALWARSRPDRVSARASSAAWVLGMAAISVLGWVWVFRRLWISPAGSWREGFFQASDAVGVSAYVTAGVIFAGAVALVVLVALLLAPIRWPEVEGDEPKNDRPTKPTGDDAPNDWPAAAEEQAYDPV